MADNYLKISGEKGDINISEDVLTVMVAAAISEVDGIAGLSNNISTELSDFFGKKAISKGVKVQSAEGSITIDVVIMVKYGYPITSVATKVQDAVASAVESMTGFGFPLVNVHVGGVAFEKQ
jgi:uncharacterized alkaline shock family protein YloU